MAQPEFEDRRRNEVPYSQRKTDSVRESNEGLVKRHKELLATLDEKDAEIKRLREAARQMERNSIAWRDRAIGVERMGQ